MYYPVLSVDGGGVFGVIPLVILRYLEQRMGHSTADLFHLLSGSSAGGITALGLSLPNATHTAPLYSAEDILKMYHHDAAQIFRRTSWGQRFSRYPLTQRLYNLFFSHYCGHGRDAYFESVFGSTRLSEAIIPVVVTAYNLASTHPKSPRLKVFSSHRVQRKMQTRPHFKGDYFMRDVAAATSAAPTYFPPKQMYPLSIQGTVCHDQPPAYMVDGGLAAYDPTLVTYLEALHMLPSNAPMVLVSLGTGTRRDSYHRLLRHKAPGILAWGPALNYLMTGPGSSSHQHVLERLLQKTEAVHYFRISCHIDGHEGAWDDFSPYHLQTLENMAHRILTTDKKEELETLVSYLRGTF